MTSKMRVVLQPRIQSIASGSGLIEEFVNDAF
jgi:hypothetical protein